MEDTSAGITSPSARAATSVATNGADTRSDGGLSKKSYPTDGTLVYEDAAPEEARVEVVEIKKLAGGTFFGIPVTGVVDTDEGYRIHVPEGSFEMEGLYSLSVQGV